jgi:hypothetical protein
MDTASGRPSLAPQIKMTVKNVETFSILLSSSVFINLFINILTKILQGLKLINFYSPMKRFLMSWFVRMVTNSSRNRKSETRSSEKN